MLAIVLPATVAPATGLLRRTVANVLSITVIYEVIIIIYVYIVVSSPSAIAAPAATPGSAHGDPNAE